MFGDIGAVQVVVVRLDIFDRDKHLPLAVLAEHRRRHAVHAFGRGVGSGELFILAVGKPVLVVARIGEVKILQRAVYRIGDRERVRVFIHTGFLAVIDVYIGVRDRIVAVHDHIFHAEQGIKGCGCAEVL